MSELGFSTRLTTGEPVWLRPIGPWDRAREIQIISRFSDHSRYLRFFTGAKTIPEQVIDRLVDVDGYDHIAWGVLELGAEGAPLMGVVRAIRRGDSDEADLALGVLDEHHSKGIARLLLLAVATRALAAGITRFTADTLCENGPARRLFKAIGGRASKRDGDVVQFHFDVATIAARLNTMGEGEAYDDLRDALRIARPLPVLATA